MPDLPSPSPVLVKDITTASNASSPSSLTLFAGSLYLFADDGLHGSELVQIDASGNTTLVNDLLPGALGSGGKLLTVVGDTLFFFAAGEADGLWTSDGTEAGTSLITALPPAAREFNTAQTVAASGDYFYFQGYDDVNGSGLWRSDGTADGTQRIIGEDADIRVQSPYSLTDVNGTLLFSAYNSTTGVELYKTTGSQLELVEDINIGENISNPRQLIAVNGDLYFTADNGVAGDELWISSGSFTNNSTAMVKNINSAAGVSSLPKNLTALNDSLYFFANAGKGYQLWTTDGTRPGTVRVGKQIFLEGAEYLSHFGMFRCDDKLYFFHRGVSNIELWQTDGHILEKVADLPEGIVFAGRGTSVNGVAYFNAIDSADTGEELWTSDGTQDGTRLISDLSPGPASSTPHELTAFNEQLFFVAQTDGLYLNQGELWQSDGTEAGTVSLDINPTTLGSSVRELTLFQGRLLFSAYDGEHAQELWSTDGSASGTQPLHDIATTSSSEPRALTVMGDQLFFFASGDAGYGLWRSDGPSASGGLLQLSNSTAYSDLVATDSHVFYSDFSDNGRELWTSDGTVAGTKLIKDINPGESGSDPQFFAHATIDDVCFFTAQTARDGRELWQSDGSKKGTKLVLDLANGTQGSNPEHLFVYDGKLYFTADDGIRGRELWRTNGVKTKLVKDIANGFAGSEPRELTVFNDSLYFIARGSELWKTNGSSDSTVQVLDLPSSSFQLTVVNDVIFFVAGNRQLWVTDGSTEGTRLLLEAPTVGSEAGAIDNLTSVNGRLYFTTLDREHGQELWRSDGTPEGTALVSDLNPHGDADPGELTYDAANNKLYFTANDWLHGDNELFALDINQTPTDLYLDTRSIDENLTANASVGSLISVDQDHGSSFTFQLVAGEGDLDNQAFTLEGNQLHINARPDYERQRSYSIRVRVTDQDGARLERILSLDVNDINEVRGSSKRDILKASPFQDDLRGLGDGDLFDIKAKHLDRGDFLAGGKGSDELRLTGATLAQGIHMDLSAANQFQYLDGIVYIPESPPTVITGMEDINLSRFGARGVLSGHASANRLVGSPFQDILTGNGGVDTFGLRALKDSLIGGIDEITDYGSDDRLEAPVPDTVLNASAGEARELSAAAIGEVLTAAVFAPNRAQAFTVAGQTGVFIAFNDRVAGFQDQSDGLLHLSGYAISALQPVVIL